jgi:hypothetical protein
MVVIAGLLVAWTTVGVPFANGQAAPERITAASNVRVRAEPSEEVPILATVPLGTSVSELEQTADGRWLRVRLPDGTEGWMAAGLTRRVPVGERHRVVRRLIGERLARDGDAFRARVELVDLVERSAEGVADAEDAAEFAYLRLQAILPACSSPCFTPAAHVPTPRRHGSTRDATSSSTTSREATGCFATRRFSPNTTGSGAHGGHDRSRGWRSRTGSGASARARSPATSGGPTCSRASTSASIQTAATSERL